MTGRLQQLPPINRSLFQYHNCLSSMNKSYCVLHPNISVRWICRLGTFRYCLRVTLFGPAEGLPQVLSGPLLAQQTWRELLMLVDVRIGKIRCFSAPQSRSASLPRRLWAASPHTRRLSPPAPPRAACRSIWPLCCGIIGSRPLTPWSSVVAGAQDEGNTGWY